MTPPKGLRPLPFRRLSRRLAELGFRPVRQVGSHVRFEHIDGRGVTVPFHARQDLDRGFVLRLLRQAEIDADEFLRGL